MVSYPVRHLPATVSERPAVVADGSGVGIKTVVATAFATVAIARLGAFEDVRHPSQPAA